MSVERFLITGCGRSGTGYTAKLLGSLGCRCGHEEVFSIAAVGAERVAWADTFPGESSWLAAPFLSILPAGTAVLHQVRDPLAVVRSLVRIRLFETPGPYLEFLQQHLEGLDRCTPLEAALRYWDEWNALVEMASGALELRYRRYRLEDLDAPTVASLLEHVDRPVAIERVSEALAKQRTDYNTRGDHSGDDGILWDTLPDCAATRAARERAARYGYAARTNG